MSWNNIGSRRLNPLRSYGQDLPREILHLENSLSSSIGDVADSLLPLWSPKGPYTSAAAIQIGDLARLDPTGGAFSVSLPPVQPSYKGRMIWVQNVTSSVNAVTITMIGVSLINGASTATINTAYGSLLIVCDGQDYWAR